MKILSIFLILALMAGMAGAQWYPRSDNYTTSGWVVAMAGADITGPVYLGGELVATNSNLSGLTDSAYINETAINATAAELLAADTGINTSISDLTLAAFTNETAINLSISDLTNAAYTNETAINVTTSDLLAADTGINTSISDLTTAAFVNETAINATASDLLAADVGINTSIASLQGNDSMIGAIASGSIQFGAAADCTSVTIGGIVYTYNATPTATLGEWGPYGANADATAAALVVGILGDTRNAGGPYFAVTANTDTVTVYQLAVGVPATPAISKTGGTDTVTIENFAGGVDPAYTDFVMFHHDVTALDVETAVLVNVPLPFAPSYYQAFITDSTGVSRPTVTDTFSVGTSPNRIILTDGGAVHVVATDIITIYAYE